jgi:hypothetical protein
VYGDADQRGYLTVWHLLELGHRRIAFVGGYYLEATHRWNGCRRALNEARRLDPGIQAAVIPREEFIRSPWKGVKRGFTQRMKQAGPSSGAARKQLPTVGGLLARQRSDLRRDSDAPGSKATHYDRVVSPQIADPHQ